MGIDVYLKWDDQSADEHGAQMTGFSVVSGHTGYLREAYHGGPYATRVLMPEGWDSSIPYHDEGIPIPAATLRERLPATVLVAVYRHHIVYGEALEEPGIIDLDKSGADVAHTITKVFADIAGAGKTTAETVAQIKPEHLASAGARIKSRDLPDYVLAFVDFVELAEKVEAAKGKPCRVYVSA